jgi:hypothetical protein
VKPGKRRQLCYFNQLAVDTAHHVILHTQADLADQKDSQCLPRVIEATNNKLTALGLGIRSVLADGAYCSGENYALLEKQGIDAYIPVHGTYKGGPDGFSFCDGGFMAKNPKWTHSLSHWKRNYQAWMESKVQESR